MKKKIITIIILLFVLQIFLPILGNAQKADMQYVPGQIEVERFIYTSSSYREAPDTIFTQQWSNNAFYKGYIPKVSWIYIEPGVIRITYKGYIQYDPTVTPNSNLNL